MFINDIIPKLFSKSQFVARLPVLFIYFLCDISAALSYFTPCGSKPASMHRVYPPGKQLNVTGERYKRYGACDSMFFIYNIM